MKVLMFSKQFPKEHPKAGESTHFVQKILHSLVTPEYKPITDLGYPPKFHTIRAGNRWKVGDMASLRVWSDKPYRSKQIEFAQVEFKKIWEVELHFIGDYYIFTKSDSRISRLSLMEIAKNDGLEYQDFKDWFNIHPKKEDESFKGQILCWSDKITY